MLFHWNRRKGWALLILSFAFLSLFVLAGPIDAADPVSLKVGATPVPAAELLYFVEPILAKQGIELEVVEFTDYVQPNLALGEGDLDANLFQHVPYLETFSADHRLDLASAVKVYLPPMAVYSEQVESLDDLSDRAQVAIPNDPTNAGRALILLEQAGLIELRPDAGVMATPFDIKENAKGLRFVELDAAQLPRALPDVGAAVITASFALEVGLIPNRDGIFVEDPSSPYVNVLATRTTDRERPAIQALAAALQSEALRQFILEEYAGAIVPAF